MTLEKNIIIETARGIDDTVDTYEHRNQLSLIVQPDRLLEVIAELKDNKNTQFDLLVDMTVIDWLDKRKPRFEVVYFLYSIEYKSRVRLKVPVVDRELKVPSVTSIFSAANWYEREAYDMYGVIFTGHPNLRRFFMPEDYKDPETGENIYPLRKDFPLMGIPDSLPLPPYPEKYGDLE